MSGQASWVLTVRGVTYVYTRGDVVFLYWRWDYVARLAGDPEAQPFATKWIGPFRAYEDYVLWCKQHASRSSEGA